MSTFLEFYLLENSIITTPLSIDFKKDLDSVSQPDGVEYKIVKDFFIDNIGKEVEFVHDVKIKDEVKNRYDRITIEKIFSSTDDKTTTMKNPMFYNRPIQKISEILKIQTSDGILFLFTVQGGSSSYFNLACDKKFSKKVEISLEQMIEFIKKFKEKSEKQKVEDLKKQKSEKAKERYKQSEPKRTATKERKKAEKEELKRKEEEEQIKQEEIKKLGSASPQNGRFGYLDINEDQYRTLVAHLKKESNIVGDKFGYVWSPETRTKDNRIFGEGRFYKIKGADKTKPESVFYLFMYFNRYLPDQGMLIFDGATAFDVFLECGIVAKAFENKRIGKDNVRLDDYKQCYWINENPKNIAPPLNAENADEINRIQGYKESTWFQKALIES